LQSFTDHLKPVGPIEANLVQSLADCSWRMNRVAAFENNVQAYAVPGGDDPIPGGISVGTAVESMAKTLANLSLHTQRLSRQFERTEKQLRELQKIRQEQEKDDLDSLLDIMQIHKEKEEAYSPSEHGFVFSDQQIADRISARRREHLALEAYEHRCESEAA
jgi:hypothetical protein